MPVRSLMKPARARLFSALIARHPRWKAGIAGQRLDAVRSPSFRSEIHRSPIVLVISALSFGLLSTIQRRGVTPFVTFRNFSGITA